MQRFESNSTIDLRFNAANAFLGTAIGDIPGHPKDGEPDTRTIVYRTFLAAPYIALTDGFEEHKWSGTNQPGGSKDPVGAVIDAFAHHSLVDSDFSAVLVDLQGARAHVLLQSFILIYLKQECIAK
jgi:hypothetical protein